MKKRWLLAFICILVMTFGFAGSVSADGDFTIENGVLISYNGGGGAVTVPAGVTAVGDNAFSDCTGLTSVSFPSTVTRIGMNAFRNCKGLTGIDIPASVNYIGWSAFSGCTSLSSVNIPGSVSTIMDRAFEDCKSLTSVALPGSVSVIRWGTFRGCSNLANIVIPVSVTSIKEYSFWECDRLKDIYYGGSSSQWKSIAGIDKEGRGLAGISPTIHYNALGAVVKVKKVAVSPKKLNLWVGNSSTIYPIITPANASNQAVTWKSSKPSVATVDANGTVYAVSRGSATITVKTVDGKKTARCTVKVDGPIAVKTVKLSRKKATVDLKSAKASTTNMKVSFNPAKATNKNVSFYNTNPEVATFTYDAAKNKVYVTGLTVGTTQIGVVSEDGGKTAVCNLTVKDTGLVKGVNIKKKATVKVGKTTKAKAKVKPGSARNKVVHYSSSDESIAVVDGSGKITGLAPGTAVITATTDESGFTARCTVTVK